ncbi:MAG TPA: hypothetical protein VK993_03135 [Chthoniobacterales bacterium]|nr:hypothetical protein [Chthoniobacterales bacterium]
MYSARRATLPGGPSDGDLKLKEQTHPLRSHPRFLNIVASLAVDED